MKCIEQNSFKLREHQLNALKKFFKVKKLLLVHGTGSGKTLTAVTISNCLLEKGLINKVIVATPKVLVDNFKKELKAAYGIEKSGKYVISTYRKTLNYLAKNNLKKYLLIIDEAHNLRKEFGKLAMEYLIFANQTNYLLLLSATPIINYPYDINNLMMMLNNSEITISHAEFKKRYFKYKKIKPIKIKMENIKHKSEIKQAIKLTREGKKLFSNKLDFYENPKGNDFPELIEKNIIIYMSKKYYGEYRSLESQRKAKRTVEIDNPTSGAFYSNLRKYTNAIKTDGYKLKWIKNKVLNNYENNIKTLIFSQFIKVGINMIIETLPENIKYQIITGKTKNSKEEVNNFNKNGKLIFISKAGAEGIDLKGVREIILMEPFWNESTKNQIIGRGVRYKSHAHLPPEERNVTVFNLFLAKPDNKIVMFFYNLKYFLKCDKSPSVDIYLLLLMLTKKRKNYKSIYRKSYYKRK
jgi:superfamily II DNA or RNA helicase